MSKFKSAHCQSKHFQFENSFSVVYFMLDQTAVLFGTPSRFAYLSFISSCFVEKYYKWSAGVIRSQGLNK